MGVRRLFPGEGKIFQGSKTYYLRIKTPKRYYFPQKKSRKTYYFGQPGGGGQVLPPADAHGYLIHSFAIFGVFVSILRPAQIEGICFKFL